MNNIDDTFVGTYVELITIDLSILKGGSGTDTIRHISNSSKQMSYNQKTYQYLPCEISGVSSGPNNQQATLSVSNVHGDMKLMFAKHGAFAGGYVTRIRTFTEFLDVETNSDNNDSYPVETWK